MHLHSNFMKAKMRLLLALILSFIFLQEYWEEKVSPKDFCQLCQNCVSLQHTPSQFARGFSANSCGNYPRFVLFQQQNKISFSIKEKKFPGDFN